MSSKVTLKPERFDVYYPFTNKEGVMCPGIKPVSRSIDEILMTMRHDGIKQLVDGITEATKAKDKERKAELKKQLPAITWCGTTGGRTRAASHMTANQLVMIDIDHVKDIEKATEEVSSKLAEQSDLMNRLLIFHITPSGEGWRFVFYAWEDTKGVKANMDRFVHETGVDAYGDYDEPVKDLSRLSFIVDWDKVVFFNKELVEKGFTYDELPIVAGEQSDDDDYEQPVGESEQGDGSLISEDEIAKFKIFDYRGTPLTVIIEKYVEKHGEPSSGEIHNFYNEMVKYFRCICDNNKKFLLWALPRFGHTEQECWSQIKSICKANTLSQLPKPFYFFLKDNGFYQPKTNTNDKRYQALMGEADESNIYPPYLPPVFREFVRIAPKDFVFPVIDALLPILGTLTSYAKSIYPYDNREHTTSFFSVIYAPPGTGKGFVERFIEMLFEDLRLRDEVQNAREAIYLRFLQRKSQNDKSPDQPHTSLRIIPAKNSEAEFLSKQKDNHGYHMFTFAAEMDSWAKGARAAGGNKDDMIRIAWDNGEYGQQFKSFNTFKGTVRLYWNVLITGTYQQLISYFKNVENGLVTRCGFTGIENQEFAPPPVWKKLSKKDIEIIRRFTMRCDANTYETPCTIVPEDLALIKDDDFDKEVDWQFKFKERKLYDCSWIMPTIEHFHKEQTKQAALALDRARDVFRRRVAVRGFRLALLCMCLWEKPRKQDLDRCKEFIDWYMHRDIEEMLRLWGEAYNGIEDNVARLPQKNLFAELHETFSPNDVYTLCLKHNVKTPVRRILFEWRRIKQVEKIDKNTYKKVTVKK